MSRALIGFFLLALTLGLLGAAGLVVKGALEARRAAGHPPEAARERVFAANVITVTASRITPVLTAFGTIEARRRLELRASVGGRIVALAPEFVDGGQVAAGQVLLRIDPARAETAAALAAAGMQEAEAELDEARRAVALAREDLAAAAEQGALRDAVLARQQDLAGRGLGTTAEREAAELAASSARQSVLSRRQALAAAEARQGQAESALTRQAIARDEAARDLAETVIRAEFAGTLAGVTAVPGGLVGANEKLGELIDPAALDLSFRISNAEFARLIDAGGQLLAQRVTAVLDVHGAELLATGTLTRASPTVGEGLTGRLVHAALDAAPGFRAGDFVTLRIDEPPLDDVARLPASAVDAAGTVLVLGADDRLEAASVQVLRWLGDDILIAAGALAGREVVAKRSPLLGAGIKLRPLRPGAEAASEPAPSMVALAPERRAELIALVEGSAAMSPEDKARVLAQLAAEQVPEQVVRRLEQRLGG